MPIKTANDEVTDVELLSSIYMDFKEYVIEAGFDHEIDWQSDLDFESVTETDFLREAAWVVLSSGFRESVVRRCFDDVSQAFLRWSNAQRIYDCRESCRKRAISCFGNRSKIQAILTIVERVVDDGFDCVKMQIKSRGVDYLQELPYIGPTTSYHLAKNIGFQVVKPDRHLLKIAQITGYESPLEMCTVITDLVGDPIAVVDIVLWRYATLNKNYDIFLSNVVVNSMQKCQHE